MRFRMEQLENYPGPQVEYSASDYHHVPRVDYRPAAKRASIAHGKNHSRQKSQFSIVSDDGLKRDSYYKDPTAATSNATKSSYDPYRASKTPIIGSDPRTPTVIVRQGSNVSRPRAGSNATSLRHPAVSRLQEEAPPLPSMTSDELARIVRLKRHSYSTGASRISLASTRRANSDAGMRKSASYKRGVSFQHHSKKSSGKSGQQSRIAEHPVTIEYPEDADLSRPSTGHRTPNIAESQSTPDLPTPPHLLRPGRPSPDMDIRRGRVASHYWRDETQKVSSELSKICEEAFNRSSISSSSMAPYPADSPTTPISVHEEATAARLAQQLKNRPLPRPPAESLGTYTLRELSETRRRLLEQCETGRPEKATHYLRDIIGHLDKLIEGGSEQFLSPERRAASDPITARNSSHIAALHRSGAAREETTGRKRNRDDLNSRSASDPVRRNERPATGLSDPNTIRLVSPDPMSPIEQILPLNIRKTSSTISIQQHDFPLIEVLPAAFEDGRYHDLEVLETIEEDPLSPWKGSTNESSGGSRKWTRTKRAGDNIDDHAPKPLPKNSPQKLGAVQTQESWSPASSEVSKTKSSSTNAEGRDATVEKKQNWFRKMFKRNKDKSEPLTEPAMHEIVHDNSDSDVNLDVSEIFHNDENGPGPSMTSRASRSRLTNPSTTANTIQHNKPMQISNNWFAKLFNIRPATKLVCLTLKKGRARKEIAKILKEWRKYGLKDVISEKREGAGITIRARVDVVNCKSSFKVS